MKTILTVVLWVSTLNFTYAQIHLSGTKSITPYFNTSLIEDHLDMKGLGLIYSINSSSSEWNIDISASRKFSDVNRITNLFDEQNRVRSHMYSARIGYYHRIIELNKPLFFKYLMVYGGTNISCTYESLNLENNTKNYISLEHDDLLSYGGNLGLRCEVYLSSKISIMYEFSRDIIWNTAGGHIRSNNKFGMRYYLFN